MRNLLAQVPVAKHRHDYASTNVTTGAWVEVFASTGAPACALEIFDSSGRVMKISTGASGQEDAGELPYYILPGGSGILLPVTLSKGARISVRAVDEDATVGMLVLNMFG